MKSSYLVYYNSDLMNYINSFIICKSCNQEYEPSEVVKDERLSKNNGLENLNYDSNRHKSIWDD